MTPEPMSYWRKLREGWDTITDHYAGNERIQKILRDNGPKRSENMFKGRELSDEEYVQFLSARTPLVLKIMSDIGGTFVIYVNGKCEAG